MAIAAIIAAAALLIWGIRIDHHPTRRRNRSLRGDLLRIGFTGSTPAAYAILAAGLAIWMTGHWIWAFKHKGWRTTTRAGHLLLSWTPPPRIHLLKGCHTAPSRSAYPADQERWAK
ncbi:hypothetical protein ACMHYT_22390 [Rhodococcus qingshengii]|uniref:hypothetical protein n=1 Tax=Rhodococcus qingshengii TaxID=334542 RepID=UPI0039C46A2E